MSREEWSLGSGVITIRFLQHRFGIISTELKMEFPHLGQHCSEPTCKQLGKRKICRLGRRKNELRRQFSHGFGPSLFVLLSITITIRPIARVSSDTDSVDCRRSHRLGVVLIL